MISRAGVGRRRFHLAPWLASVRKGSARLLAGPKTVPLMLGAMAAVSPVVILAKSILPVPSTPRVPFVGATPPSCARRTVDAGSAGTRGPIAFAQLPGRVLSTTDRVAVFGAPTFRTRGEFEMVDVHLDPVSTWLGLDLVRRDCRTDLFNRRQILGDGSVQQATDDDRKLMSASQDLAIYVALHRLGIPVAVHNGGVVVESFCVEGTDSACAGTAPAASLLRAGDIITAIDGQPVQLEPDLAPLLAKHTAGDLVEVDISRGSLHLASLVPLVSDGNGHATLGVIASPLLPATTTFDYPFDVEIDVGRVGGPSAGLAFTLTLIDQLSAGELAGGTHTAVTGEIAASGRVGTIGGIRQKTIAVRDAGASAFLVPKSQAAEAARAAQGSDLKVLGVATLDDALKVLATLGGEPLPSSVTNSKR